MSQEERIDKWLFHARLYRSRALAQVAAASGRVRLNGAAVTRPGRTVRPGDILTLGKGGQVMALKVLGLAARRGSAPDARALYEIVAD